MVRPETLRHRLNVLLDALADLRRYRDSISLEKLRSDRDTQHMVLHAMYVAAQAAIDIAFHKAADGEQVLAPAYRDVFAHLASGASIEPGLADRLAGWAGLRNVLAHQYARVDYALIHRALVDDLGDLEALALLATGWLDDSGAGDG